MISQYAHLLDMPICFSNRSYVSHQKGEIEDSFSVNGNVIDYFNATPQGH